MSPSGEAQWEYLHVSPSFQRSVSRMKSSFTSINVLASKCATQVFHDHLRTFVVNGHVYPRCQRTSLTLTLTLTQRNTKTALDAKHKTMYSVSHVAIVRHFCVKLFSSQWVYHPTSLQYLTRAFIIECRRLISISVYRRFQARSMHKPQMYLLHHVYVCSNLPMGLLVSRALIMTVALPRAEGVRDVRISLYGKLHQTTYQGCVQIEVCSAPSSTDSPRIDSLRIPSCLVACK